MKSKQIPKKFVLTSFQRMNGANSMGVFQGDNYTGSYENALNTHSVKFS